MKIKSMTACFGRLDHARLELADGLNILHAPNEAGKSTWCAFIRAMLYGVSSRERDKKGYLAEKNRYQPWSGAPMEGEMVLEWREREITLHRFTKGATPFGGFSAVYTDTQQPVPELTAQNCGEVLLGVERGVWERSAFIGSAPTLAIDGTPELERRIAALVSSGEEDVSYSQTEAKLREWLRRRQHNRSGLIPRLEEELEETNGVLARMEAASRRLVQAQEQRPALQEQQRELEEELELHRRLARQGLNSRYAQALEEQVRVRAQLDALQAQQGKFGVLPHRDLLRDAQSRLQRLTLMEEDVQRSAELVQAARQSAQQTAQQAGDDRFAGLDGQQAVAQALRDRMRAEMLLQKGNSRRKWRPVLMLPGIVLGAAVAVIGWLTGQSMWFIAAGCAAGLGLALLLPYLFGRGAQAANGQAKQLLDQYKAAALEEISAAAEAYRLRQEQVFRTHEEYKRLEASYIQSEKRMEAEQGGLLSFVRSFAPGVDSVSGCAAALSLALELEDRLREGRERLELASRRCDDLKAQGAQEVQTTELLHAPERTLDESRQMLQRVQARLAELDREEAMAKGELLTLGDRVQLEARREQILSRLECRRREYEALTLALDGLRQANAALQERFAPELNRRSGEILSALTGGRYDSLTLDREFEAAARSTDSLLPRSTLALSRGTADQIYLAVRLAVCQLCLSEEEPSPLVLDDALLTFDDARMELAVDYLSGFGRQVLLFSCQQREGRLGIGNILPLQS